MAEHLPFTMLPGQREKVLAFLNRISDPTEITDSRLLRDDPLYDGSGGYTIGDKVATNLINAREDLPQGKYKSIDQVLEVPGMGPDKVRDLMASFWQPAAVAFHKRLFSGILLDNWKVKFWPFDFEHKAGEFKELVNDQDKLRTFIAKNVLQIIIKEQQNRTIGHLAQRLIQHAHIEHYHEDFSAIQAFALWWHQFDPENWFSFEQIRDAIAHYINYYQQHQNGLELLFFQGFINGGTLAEAVTRENLPVIINHGEHRITIWSASLYD